MCIDRKGLLKGANLVLELGAGSARRVPGAITIDLVEHPNVDVVGDALEVLRALPAASVAEIHSAHFFEHVPDLLSLVEEIARVLKPGGYLCAVVPHWSNPYFYSDPTHVRAFGLYSFNYFADCSFFRRQLPNYGINQQLRVAAVRIGFRSDTVRVVHWVKRLFVEPLVNRKPGLQEIYEEHLSHWLPAFELTWHITRL